MPLVFLSHAATDSVIAKDFQKDVKADFLGMCDIFVSSNLDSLQAGYEWQQVIKKNLAECAILIGLLSPEALSRGWVYAEFGAGWIRDVPTIPVCHSGLERGQLPPPISTFQGLNLWEGEHLEHLYGLISAAIGCQRPEVDFSDRSEKYRIITEDIRINRVVVSWTRQLFDWNPQLKDTLSAGNADENVLIPGNLDQAFQEYIGEASERGYLHVERRGMGMGTRVGPQASIFEFRPGDQFGELLARLNG